MEGGAMAFGVEMAEGINSVGVHHRMKSTYEVIPNTIEIDSYSLIPSRKIMRRTFSFY
jgi:hypothetical protein